MSHSFRPLPGMSRTFCQSCGLVALRGTSTNGQCRGHRPRNVGSVYLAMKSLQHDWRNNPAGYAKHYGGGMKFKSWEEDYS